MKLKKYLGVFVLTLLAVGLVTYGVMPDSEAKRDWRIVKHATRFLTEDQQDKLYTLKQGEVQIITPDTPCWVVAEDGEETYVTGQDLAEVTFDLDGEVAKFYIAKDTRCLGTKLKY